MLVFNSLKQSKDFDKDGKYIKKWCPELKNVPTEFIHAPWTMPKISQKTHGVTIGDTYPEPINCLKYTSPEAFKKEKAAQKKQKSD